MAASPPCTSAWSRSGHTKKRSRNFWGLRKMFRNPLLCGLLAACSLSFAQTNVLLMPKLDPVPAKAGATVEVKVPVQLRDGYHVNSNTPPDPYLIPLRLTWEPGPFTAFEIVYPQPSMQK